MRLFTLATVLIKSKIYHKKERGAERDDDEGKKYHLVRAQARKRNFP